METARASTQNTLNIQDYLAIARRRFLYFALAFLVVLIAGIIVVLVLPPVYRSTGKIGVESQQIPVDLVRSTVTSFAAERIGFIQQRIMTDTRLEEVIEKFGLYPEEREYLLAEKLRQHISVEIIRDPFAARLGAIAFTVSFEHETPLTAQNVATELVKMFLDENVETRTARATETTEFLKQQARMLDEQVRAIDQQIAAFKQKHREALPEHLDLRVSMLTSAESTLSSLQRDIAAAEEEKRFLETQRASVGAMLSPEIGSTRSAMSPQQQLAMLNTELTEKSAVYRPAHPDIRRLKGRIAALERYVRSSPTAPSVSSKIAAPDPASAQIESRIRSANSRLTSLRDQKQELQARIEKLQAQIIETPQVERGLRKLTLDYESSVRDHEDVRSKQQQAQLAQNLEQQEKAERFLLLEPPNIPSEPVQPKLKLFALAFLLALGSGTGVAFAAEFLDNTIRGPTMLTSVLGRKPLAVIPYIENTADHPSGRIRHVLIWLALILLLVVALALTHFLYQPLDAL